MRASRASRVRARSNPSRNAAAAIRRRLRAHERNKNRRVRLLRGQGEILPFRDGAFDHVYSLGSFNYFSNPAGSLREMARVVRPGGRLAVTHRLVAMHLAALADPWVQYPEIYGWVRCRSYDGHVSR